LSTALAENYKLTKRNDNETALRERKPPPRRLTLTESDPGFESGFPD